MGSILFEQRKNTSANKMRSKERTELVRNGICRGFENRNRMQKINRRKDRWRRFTDGLVQPLQKHSKNDKLFYNQPENIKNGRE